MLVVAIAGILLAAGLPSFRESLANQRAKSAASELHLSLLMARSEAIKRSANIEMFSSGGTWTNGWVVRLQSDPSVNLRSSDSLNAVDVECSTDTDDAAETCPSTITFNRTGRPTSTIEFRTFVAGQSTVKARCVSMSLGGRPRVVQDTDGDKDNGCD